MKDDLKTKILRSSLELMHDGDVSALSMRAVARRAGVSHQAPYHYFADREAILAELVKEGYEKLYAAEEAAVSKEDNAEARITAMGRAYIQFAQENPALFRLMFRCDMVDLDNHAEAKTSAEKAFDVLFRVIGSRLEGDEELQHAAVIGCWSLAHGLATLTIEGVLDNKLKETSIPVDELAQNTLALFAKKLLYSES